MPNTKPIMRLGDRLQAFDSESQSREPIFPTLAEVRPGLFSATADKTVANTVTETSLFGTGVGSLTLPANYFVAGKTIRVRMKGYIGNTSTPTIQIKSYVGTTAIADTTAQAMVALTGNHAFRIDALFTCRAVGGASDGAVIGQIHATYENSTSAYNISSVTTAAVNVSTIVDKAIDLKLTWGTAAAANTATITNAIVDVIY